MTITPYPEPGGDDFTSGHSGSDTSRERVEREDADGTTGKRQALVLAAVRSTSMYGATVHEISYGLWTHHGQTSSALTALERDGRVVRLVERRNRCHLYVAVEHVNGRPVYIPPARAPRALQDARVERLAALARHYEAAGRTQAFTTAADVAAEMFKALA